MKWAIYISIFLHALAVTLVFRHSQLQKRAYPPVMIVHLSSPPPSLGVPNPETKTAQDKTPPKTIKKIQKTPEDTRMAEVNAQKKPKRQQPETKPKPAPEPEKPITEEADPRMKGLPNGVQLGSEFGGAKLDDSGFDSPFYLNVLFGKIRNQWENPYLGSDLIQCTIYFVISRDGHIVDSAIETSSGILDFDQAALRAVLATKPPPLPNQFDSDELGIHLEFQYLPQ